MRNWVVSFILPFFTKSPALNHEVMQLLLEAGAQKDARDSDEEGRELPRFGRYPDTPWSLVDFGWIWGLAPYNTRVTLYIRVIMGHCESTTHNCFYFVGDWLSFADFWFLIPQKRITCKKWRQKFNRNGISEQKTFCSEGTCGKSNPRDGENI